MLKDAGGLTFQIVNKTEFSNIETWIPSNSEQKKIGSLFYKLDNLITLHQRKPPLPLLLARKPNRTEKSSH